MPSNIQLSSYALEANNQRILQNASTPNTKYHHHQLTPFLTTPPPSITTIVYRSEKTPQVPDELHGRGDMRPRQLLPGPWRPPDSETKSPKRHFDLRNGKAGALLHHQPSERQQEQVLRVRLQTALRFHLRPHHTQKSQSECLNVFELFD